MLVYVVMIVLSYLIQQLDAKQSLFTLMIVLMFVFIFTVCVSFMFLDPIFRRRSCKVVPEKHEKPDEIGSNDRTSEKDDEHSKKNGGFLEDTHM